jgi:colanic acid/amylovoran biosynthesis glycosyltransferase
MLRVAHIRDCYLRQTETFIYDIFARHQNVEGYFFCERRENLDQFPAKNVFSIDELGWIGRQRQHLSRRLAGRFPHFTELCRRHSIGLIHAHFAPSGFYALATAKTLDIPVITSFYGQDVFEIPSNERWRARYRRLFAEGDLFLSLSEDMTKDLVALGCPREKIRVYRLGIDLSDFAPIERPARDRLRILTIARLVEKKGIEYLIRAAAQLVKEDAPVELRIVGDGPLMPELAALSKELSADSAVTFAGRIPFAELPAEMAAADIFCLPSVTDRFGGKDEISMVLKEAMGTAMPIVATFHAGIPEVIQDGVNGLLVPERDVESLHSALARLAESDDLRRRIGNEGRNLVERVWEIRRQVAVLESIFSEVAGR